ncbi:MAG: 50S ribosomal protein L29 [Crenarchaeota archaeon]|nr:50S ribosomal protein L29 [Thermoproteota archaeon]
MSREDRQKLLEQLRTELLKLISQKERGVVDNPGKIRAVRRAIARIMTIENEETLKEKVISFLTNNKGRAFTVEELAEKINEPRISFLKHVIERLVLEKKVVKVGVRKVAIAQ